MPRFVGRYEAKWESDLRRLGLAGPNFDYFWRELEEYVLDHPSMGKPVPDGSGARSFKTDEALRDVPRLVGYYKPDFTTERVVFLGLDEAWTEEDLPPPELRR
jgi:hypothetical protein